MGTGRAIIRAATGADLAALTDAGLAGMNWTGEDRFTLEEYLSQPNLARYLAGWPRPGDFGVVAETAEGTPVGAAWCRLFAADDAGYGFVDGHTPELTIGVLADHRGTGIGTALMKGLIAEGSARAVPAISLSVEDGNRARVLYERLGFRKVGRNGGSDTLLLKLGPA
ncbi:MAG TPA: GNAT family N-acetyltransferase [Arthrobacter sp.]|nr:GNAT family N-acetyltransferase [Arthrobacter sp.]